MSDESSLVFLEDPAFQTLCDKAETVGIRGSDITRYFLQSPEFSSQVIFDYLWNAFGRYIIDDDVSPLHEINIPDEGIPFLEEIPGFLTHAEVYDLVVDKNEGNAHAGDQLLLGHTHLIIRMAHYYSMVDCVQDGYLGLLKLCQQPDTQPEMFVQHAIWYIRSSLIRAMLDQKSSIPTPAHVRTILQKMRDLQR